jgi:hypothetical protein
VHRSVVTAEANSKRGLKYGLIAAGVAVIGGGATAGYYALRGDHPESAAAAATAAASASASSAAVASEQPLPAQGALAAAVPEDVDFYAEVPDIAGLAKASRDMKVTRTSVAELLEAYAAAAKAIEASFEIGDGGAVVSALGSAAFAGRVTNDKPYAGVAIATADRAAIARLLASKRFTAAGEIGGAAKYRLGKRTGAPAGDGAAALLDALETPPEVALAWFEKRGLLAAGTDAFLEALVAVGEGKAKPLRGVAGYQAARKELGADARVALYLPAEAVARFALMQGGGALAVEVQAMLDGYFKDPGPMSGGLFVKDGGLVLALHAGLQGDKLPAFSPPPPPALTLAQKLPADTLAYYAFASKSGLKGKELVQLAIDQVKKHDLSQAADIEREVGEIEKGLGATVAQVLDAMGDQGAIALLAADKVLDVEHLSAADLSKSLAVVFVQHLADKAEAKRIIDGVKGRVLTEGRVKELYDFSASDDGGFDARPKKPDMPHVALRYPADLLFVGVGADALVQRGLDAIKDGKGPALAAESAHRLAVSSLPKDAHALLWLDAPRLLGKTAATELAGLGLEKYLNLSGDERITAAISYGLRKDGARWRVRLDQLNAFAVLPAIGIYGVRRYLASAKTSEAKNTLGAIARGAMASFEREGAPGAKRALCKSANPVPSTVPSGRKYQPATSPGSDYETGDDTTGWACLRFSMTQPQYYQYGYTAGGPYKGPAHGGPDPGPNGFEAWAIGDLDGDGVTSLFTLTGSVDATGTLERATEIFIHNEFE